jgi:hypothetical protein
MPGGTMPGGSAGELPAAGAFPGGEAAGGAAGTAGRFGGSGGFGGGGMGGGVSSALLSYLEKNQGGATWLVAVSSAQSAAEMILQSGGKPVIGMGGFTGDDPAMSLATMKSLIASGKLRYVLLGGAGGMGGPGGGSANSAATAYVKSTCAVVKASAYGGSDTSSTTSSSTSSSASSSSAASGQVLYDCKA